MLNLLRGLNPKFRYVKPVITSKSPLHTFQSARSFLILEELSVDHDATVEAGQALTASHGATNGGSSSNASGPKDTSSAHPAPRSNNNRSSNGNGYNSGGNRNNRNDRRRGNGGGRNNGGGGARSNNNGNASNANAAPWTAGYNPWQGMVQAWPMPFRAPGAGVLGPRPPFQPQQAMAAVSNNNVFDPSALYAALQSSNAPQPPPNTSDWYFDTGATSHMSSSPDNFPPTPSVLLPLSLQSGMVLACQPLVEHEQLSPLPPHLSV